MTPRRDPSPRPETDRPADGGLVAHVEETPDGAECTLYPADADPDTLPTTWLTADAAGFVDLAEMR